MNSPLAFHVLTLLLAVSVCCVAEGKSLRTLKRRRLLRPMPCASNTDCNTNYTCSSNGRGGMCLGNYGVSCIIDYLCTTNVCEPLYGVCSQHCESGGGCPDNFTCTANRVCSPNTPLGPIGVACKTRGDCYGRLCYAVPTDLYKSMAVAATNVSAGSIESALNATTITMPSYCSKNCDQSSPWFSCPRGTFCYIPKNSWSGYCLPTAYQTLQSKSIYGSKPVLA